MTYETTNGRAGAQRRRPTAGDEAIPTTRRRFLKATGIGALAIGVGGGSATTAAAQDSGSERNAMTFDVSPLPDLDTGYYEGWAIFGEEKVSTGTFSADDDLLFEIADDLAEADEIAITIEPDDEPGGAPSGVVILAGGLDGDRAELSYPVSFDDVAGSYILATPTAPLVSGESGVWFLEPGDPPSPSLSLPSLPTGWTYEGWVVHGGRPITTGRFDGPSGTDAASPYSGTGDAPPFPGEDLITNEPDGLVFPTDLTDGETAIAITVEPDIDGMAPTGSAPFPIKVLDGQVPADAEVGTSYDLTPSGEPFPSGTATLYDDAEAAMGIDLSEYTARDLDGDERYEDVNGNGTADFDDVVVFFEELTGNGVQENVDAFDFNGNGGIDFDDVVALFESV